MYITSTKNDPFPFFDINSNIIFAVDKNGHMDTINVKDDEYRVEYAPITEIDKAIRTGRYKYVKPSCHDLDNTNKRVALLYLTETKKTIPGIDTGNGFLPFKSKDENTKILDTIGHSDKRSKKGIYDIITCWETVGNDDIICSFLYSKLNNKIQFFDGLYIQKYEQEYNAVFTGVLYEQGKENAIQYILDNNLNIVGRGTEWFGDEPVIFNQDESLRNFVLLQREIDDINSSYNIYDTQTDTFLIDDENWVDIKCIQTESSSDVTTAIYPFRMFTIKSENGIEEKVGVFINGKHDVTFYYKGNIYTKHEDYTFEHIHKTSWSPPKIQLAADGTFLNLNNHSICSMKGTIQKDVSILKFLTTPNNDSSK